MQTSLCSGLQNCSDCFDFKVVVQFGSPLESNPLESNPLKSSPLKSSPLKYSPLKSSPLKYSPLKSSTLKSSPLKSSPLKISTLKSSPLKIIPLKISALKCSPLKSNPLKSNWGIYVRFLLVRLWVRIHSEDAGRGYEHMHLFMFHLAMLSVTREQACIASYGRIFSEY
jgi:hypothetical protein